MILLDAGHGGIDEGVYVTPNKRHYDSQVKIAEGQLNRAVINLVGYELHKRGVPISFISGQIPDTSLSERVRRVNWLSGRHNCFLLSIHHNWFSSPVARGAEFFTSIGDTDADEYAEYIYQRFMAKYPHRKARKDYSDGDADKEANFRILRETYCPAVLSEWGFMSNAWDREYMTMQGILDQSEFLVECLCKIEKDLVDG